MTSSGKRPLVFPERPNDRRRRLVDAAWFLPIAGAAFLAIPVLWPEDQDIEAGSAVPVQMSEAMFYVFGVWLALIGLAALFGIWSKDWEDDPVRRATSQADGRETEQE